MTRIHPFVMCEHVSLHSYNVCISVCLSLFISNIEVKKLKSVPSSHLCFSLLEESGLKLSRKGEFPVL